MRRLALDVGDVRIGVAVGDPTGTVVEPLDAIIAPNRALAIEKVRELVEKERVGEVVVGMPVSLNGDLGPQARKVRTFAEMLDGQISCPVRLWDESYSSRAADAVMAQSGVGKKRRKGRRDSVAAAVVLREYLQSLDPKPAGTT